MVASADFKKRLVYIAGDRRFGKIPASSTEIIKLWVRKEFKNLQLAHSSGVRVPRPYSFLRNVIVMEYIGEPPAPAPTMAEAEVDLSDYKWVFSSISKLNRTAELVQADFPENNIFKWGDEGGVFDVGCAVKKPHPRPA